MSNPDQQYAGTSLTSPQMEGLSVQADMVDELRRLQAQVERFRYSGDQSPDALSQRNEVESRYNQLWIRLRDQGRA